MWPETPRVWLDLGAPAHGGSPRVPWAQVIMLEKEIPDLAVTQFPAKQTQCPGLRGHHAASHEMARHSSMLPSKMLANRVVAGAQEGGDHSSLWCVGAEVGFWIGLKAEPTGLLMDWLGHWCREERGRSDSKHFGQSMLEKSGPFMEKWTIGQGHSPSRGSKGLPASSGSRELQASLGSWLHVSSLCLCCHVASPYFCFL